MSRPAAEVAKLLGLQVREARAVANITAAELAARAGVTARTVRLIESGSPQPTWGNVLNVAVAARVPLFGTTDPETLTRARFTGEQRLALLPSRVYHPRQDSADGRCDF